MSAPALRTHTDAVIAKLEAAGLNVGDADAEGLTAPYAVLYDIPGGRSFGTLENPNDDAELVFQVTCVGETREQSAWVADKAITALLSGLTVSGRSIARVTIDSFPGTFPERDASPPLFTSTPRFRLTTTPG